jgi:hypothetical protein
MHTTGPISGEWYNQCILLVISTTKDLRISNLRIRYALVKKDPLNIEVIQHSTQSTVLLLLSLMAENMYEDTHLDTGSYLQTQNQTSREWRSITFQMWIQFSKHHTWNSLNRERPRLATISNRPSKCFPSVVSLYGTHSANVRKSNMDDTTSAPVPRFWNMTSTLIVKRQFAVSMVHLVACSTPLTISTVESSIMIRCLGHHDKE